MLFLFGNEHEGLTEEALLFADSNIIIPQFGMVQSLNISVACAVTLFESARQRISKGMYKDVLDTEDLKRKSYYEHFIKKHK